MAYFLVKVLISAILVATISEVARRQPTLGALVASLPLLSILAVIWLWRDSHDPKLIAYHLEATFWLLLPSLPMFLVVPALLRSGIGFWPSLGAGSVLTIGLYGALVLAARMLKIAL
jgi:hypothetical protein